MTRPPLPRLLACLLAAGTGLAGATLTTAGAAVADDEPGITSTRTPLRVTVETLAPATIPQRGRVTITGRIVNRSEQTWTDLNVYLLTSATPISSRAELAGAAAAPVDKQVGFRRASEGLYDEVGDLAPGRSVAYRVSVRRADLGISGRPGVYWVGIHVLGALDGVRDTAADGRARTFMPLLPRTGTVAADQARTRLALLVRLGQPVRRGPAGRLIGLPAWQAALAPDGRLDRLLRLGRETRERLTWVVDPALLDAVRSVGQGDPRIDTGPSGPADGAAGPSASPSGPATQSPGPDPSPSGLSSGSDADQPTAAALRARAWLEEFRRQVPDRTVAAVPYGDLDVAAALGSGSSPDARRLYRRAAALSRQTLATYGVADPLPLVAPTTGYLPATALDRLPRRTPVLLAAAAYPQSDTPVVTRTGRAPVVLTDGTAGDGGPRPNSQYAALAFRQRLLSEAALHALSDRRDAPLVVPTPPTWNPGDAWAQSEFFAGLDQPWLQLVDLPSVAATAPASTAADAGPLAYPQADRDARVPLSNLRASRTLIGAGAVFARLLTANDTVDDTLARVAMLGSSTSARGDVDLARARTAGTIDYVRSQLARVHIEGPQFVMMSGESGPIQVTLVNDLDQPVTVGLRMTTPGSNLRITPVDPVRLGPGRRTSLRLSVSADDIGVHAVTLATTDPGGTPLGSQTQLSVRTSHVSTVIWVVMGIGGALLLLAIALRVFRRIRRRQSTHGPLLPHDDSRRPTADQEQTA